MSQRLATSSNPEASGFAAVLRDHTKSVHRAAERAGFVADLLHGRATLAGYALFLRNLHPAYAALEARLKTWAGHPLAGAFADPALRRLGPLTADLQALTGTNWMALPLLPAAGTYAAAIAAAAADPDRLAAHAYARYMGDLSGGQILAPFLGRTLRLSPDALAFYAFPGYPDIASPKAAMRAALDTVPVEGSRAAAICEETVAAFAHNIAVSEAVQAALVHT